MRIEPVPTLVGHLAVPGDKSISHRAVLIAAICDGETRIAGFGRSADTEATIAAVRALGVDVVEEDVDTLRVARGRVARAAAARRADRLRERGHAHAPARRRPRRPGGSVRARRRRVALRAADGARRRAAPPDGRSNRDLARLRAARRRGLAASRDRLRASRRVRAGEVGRAPRGDPGGRAHDRRRADPDARPHRAPARACRRGCHAAAEQRLGRACVESPARGSGHPGRHLVGCAVSRRRRDRSGIGRHGARRRAQPAAHRPPRRARAHGREDLDLQPSDDRRRAGRRRRNARLRSRRRNVDGR